MFLCLIYNILLDYHRKENILDISSTSFYSNENLIIDNMIRYSQEKSPSKSNSFEGLIDGGEVIVGTGAQFI